MSTRSPGLDDETAAEIPREAPVGLLTAEPFLEVLYHPWLAFWGRVTAPGALSRGRPVVLGRKTLVLDPAHLFGEDGDEIEPEPLGDPCLSREHAQIRYSGGAFFVTALGPADALSLSLPTGEPGHLGEPCPPGSLLTLGRRLMVRLAFRTSPVAWRHWYHDRRDLPRAEGRAPLGLVGESEAMWQLRRRILELPPSASDVLVVGPSGAGKELVAKAIHEVVRPPDAPYVALNCAAIPGTLLETELFGHTPRAFSGADAGDSGKTRRGNRGESGWAGEGGRLGAFREAHGGTIFLDEIADLSIEHQAKLNRVLEARTVTPLGGNHRNSLPVDVLTISATWQDLDALVAAGRFRADLQFRFARFVVAAPPLGVRHDDIPLLVRRILERLCALESDERPGRRSLASVFPNPGSQEPLIPLAFIRGLLLANWKHNNVRELHNTVQRAAATFCAGGAFCFDIPEATEAPNAIAARSMPGRLHPSRRRPAEIPFEEWRTAYAELGSVRLVASRFAVATSTASEYLERAGVQMPPPNRRGRRRGD